MFLAALQAAGAFMMGPFAIPFTALCAAACFFAAMPPFRMMPIASGFISLFLGALACSALWLAQQFVRSGGGGFI